MIDTKKHKKKALSFLTYFSGSFIVVYLLLSKTFLYRYINYFFGTISNFFINLLSINTTFIFDDVFNLSIIVVSAIDYPIFISYLCTGILEFCLLVSAIFATREVIFKKRLLWILFSLLLVVFFNIFRIVLTTLTIVLFSVSLANIFHEILFRLFLIVVVVGFYYLFLKKNIKN